MWYVQTKAIRKYEDSAVCLLFALCFKKALLWHFTNENKKDVIMLRSIVSCILFIFLMSYFWSDAVQISLICENFAWQTNGSRLYRSGQQSWRGIKTKEMWSQTIQQKLKKEEPNRSTDSLMINFSWYLGYSVCLTKFGISFYVRAMSQKLNILVLRKPVKGKRGSKSTSFAVKSVPHLKMHF